MMTDQLQGSIQKAVVVVGSPRSGTTFLSQMFRVHRQVAYLIEPRLVWRYGNDRKSDLLTPEDARPEVCRHIRTEFARFVEREGKQRLAEKTPSNSLRMGFVDRVLPDCRFVHIIRNGYDAALSIRKFWLDSAGGVGSKNIRAGVIRQRLKELNWRRLPFYAKEAIRRVTPDWLSGITGPKLWGPRIPGMEQMAKEMDLLEVCCLQWRMCVELACQYGRGLPSDRYMEMKLEDLTQDRVRAMMRFCELDDDPNVLAYLEEHFKPEKATARQSKADPREIETIRRWVEPTLRWLDYPVR